MDKEMMPTGIEEQILSTDDPSKLEELVSLFNLNLQKKNIVRTGRLNELQEKVTNQMEERLLKKADEFSNKDLLDYFKVIQETISKSDTTLENIDNSAIYINQNQFNISVEDKLDRASKERVTNAVKSILEKLAKENTYTEDVIDVDTIEEVDT